MTNPTLYCTVPPCNFSTNEGPQLLKHLDAVHPVPNIHTRYCNYPQCNFSSNWNAAFENHLKTVHYNNKQRFGCNLCHTNTSNKSNLTKHCGWSETQQQHSTDTQSERKMDSWTRK